MIHKLIYSIDYFLLKDGSWISEIFENEEKFLKKQKELTKDKYKIASYTSPDLGTVTFTSKMHWNYRHNNYKY